MHRIGAGQQPHGFDGALMPVEHVGADHGRPGHSGGDRRRSCPECHEREDRDDTQYGGQAKREPEVCFAGIDDLERYERHNRQLGLEPVAVVTIKNCQLLVAADSASRSGKADKARKYGHPLVSGASFLQAGAGETVEGVATTVGLLDTLTCTACDRAWTRPASRGRKPELCPACR